MAFHFSVSIKAASVTIILEHNSYMCKLLLTRAKKFTKCISLHTGNANLVYFNFKTINPLWRYHHHHHHIALVARISLTLSRHSSLPFIALGRSSGQHPVSSHSCWMYVRASRPAFPRLCAGIHKSTSLMSSSLLLQQCPACLVLLTWIVFVIGGRWPYSWCLVGCCCQDLFRIAFLCNCHLASSPAILLASM